jgi:5-(carboxyamino)imidazole ribonucleotide mutase
VEQFARNAEGRGIKVIIAAAGMAAALPGVIAASTTLPVIGVPIKGMLDGLDAMLSIIQMPPGIPVATVGVNGAMNAAILAMEMLALTDKDIAAKMKVYKASLGKKIEKANKDLAEVKYEYKTN